METPSELDLALMTFPKLQGAELAYANARERAAGEPWLAEVALVEHHSQHRLNVRGNVAGHYVDVDDHGDPIGKETAKGALTAGAIGLLFGPPAAAAGFIGGATIGGNVEAESVPHHHNALLDDFRAEIPEGGSALALLAPPDHVDQMVSALANENGELIRHHLDAERARKLVDAVADAPATAQ